MISEHHLFLLLQKYTPATELVLLLCTLLLHKFFCCVVTLRLLFLLFSGSESIWSTTAFGSLMSRMNLLMCTGLCTPVTTRLLTMLHFLMITRSRSSKSITNDP